ncbi:MAG TPA: DMT family transporter [Alphaproteobacteria bacterium]
MTKPALLSPIAAVLIALTAYLLFTIGDASAKWLLTTYSEQQIIFSVNLVGIVIMGSLAAWMRGPKKIMATEFPKMHVIRAAFMVTNTLLVLYVLKNISLAVFYGIVFQGPIWVAILSVIFFKERIPVKEWIAIVTGFFGVLVIVGPEFANLNLAFFLAMLIPILGSCGALLARQIGKDEPVTNFALWFHVSMVAVSGLMLPGHFILPTLPDMALMVLYGIVTSLALMCISMVFARSHAVSQVAPLQYTQMLWGVLIGLIVFHEKPAVTTLVGGAIVIASGIYVLHNLRRGRIMNR